MLKIYDKAQWHIDAGEDKYSVINKMKALFDFLDSKGYLTEEGKEIIKISIDDSASIHERILSEEGNKFMESQYDNIINTKASDFSEALERAFKEFKNK